MFEITALDQGCPPLHLYVYTSCERPSIYGQLKNTNNHPPRVKNLLLLSAKFCNAFVYAHAAFWLPVYYYSVSAEPMGIRPIPKRCQAFPSLFLSVTSLCIPLKHTDPCLVCSLGGTHHTQQRLNTRCTRFLLTVHFWKCIKGRCRSWIQSHCLPKSWRHLHDQCAFHCDETLTCNGFTFSVEICNLPT